MDSGKGRRLRRIFRDNHRTVIVPMDHGVTLGPVQGIADIHRAIQKLRAGGADAFVLHKGIAKNADTARVGLTRIPVYQCR